MIEVIGEVAVILGLAQSPVDTFRLMRDFEGPKQLGIVLLGRKSP